MYLHTHGLLLPQSYLHEFNLAALCKAEQTKTSATSPRKGRHNDTTRARTHLDVTSAELLVGELLGVAVGHREHAWHRIVRGTRHLLKPVEDESILAGSGPEHGVHALPNTHYPLDVLIRLSLRVLTVVGSNDADTHIHVELVEREVLLATRREVRGARQCIHHSRRTPHSAH